MQNRGIEISREITDEDLELYRRMGYRDNPGTPQPVLFPEENAQTKLYPSWRDIMDLRSPWTEYIRNPYEILEYWQSYGRLIPEGRYSWIRERNRRKSRIQQELDQARELKIKTDIGRRIMNPKEMFFSLLSDDKSLISSPVVALGDLIFVVMPDRKKILELANAVPWGRKGGFQLLANILQRPITANASEFSSQEFFPSFEPDSK